MLVCRLHNIVSWKLLPNIDSLMDDSLDIKNTSSLMNTLDVCVEKQPKHEDSNDSDDYADSDN